MKTIVRSFRSLMDDIESTLSGADGEYVAKVASDILAKKISVADEQGCTYNVEYDDAEEDLGE